MKKGKVLLIIVCLFCSTLVSLGDVAGEDTQDPGDKLVDDEKKNNIGILDEGDPHIEIISPEVGYLYLFKLQPIKMPLSSSLNLGYAVVIDRSLQIDTQSNDIHHVKFVAKGLICGSVNEAIP